ncbi:unnamed protein product [marine sediment metagenome]|uniref:Uncharacterized protein n=1 Tax=marine sediment metagenome TaxID=412755 RepID=X1SLR1_9ZZZZ
MDYIIPSQLVAWWGVEGVPFVNLVNPGGSYHVVSQLRKIYFLLSDFLPAIPQIKI